MAPRAFTSMMGACFTQPLAAVAVGLFAFGGMAGADPLSSNNGFYPAAGDYSGPYVAANLDYPRNMPNDGFLLGNGFADRITTRNAEEYMFLVKEYLSQSFSTIIDAPENWDPVSAGWYDLVWSGNADGPAGKNPTSGREPLMNTYTGQIIPRTSFFEGHRPDPDVEWVQNHAVIYYNGVAAHMLGQVWADLYDADISMLDFPEGSVVIKAEATTPPIDKWESVLKGAQTWEVFRPTTDDQANGVKPLVPEVVKAHPLQISVKIKDSRLSPHTGWIFMAFVYDAFSDGETHWDRFVPLGAMWGNDPKQTSDPSGRVNNQPLTETWINPGRPAFTTDTLGWGGRLAGPMDVATRQGVITTSGGRFGSQDVPASSCMSCHGAGEYPFTANLYPSPNKVFPPNGKPFLLYDPGSPEWADWFQNRPGNVAQSTGRGPIATDYDMAIMFALGATPHVSGRPHPGLERFSVH